MLGRLVCSQVRWDDLLLSSLLPSHNPHGLSQTLARKAEMQYFPFLAKRCSYQQQGQAREDRPWKSLTEGGRSHCVSQKFALLFADPTAIRTLDGHMGLASSPVGALLMSYG